MIDLSVQQAPARGGSNGNGRHQRGGRVRDLVAAIWQNLGKGGAYVTLAAFEFVVCAWLWKNGVATDATTLGVINAAVYGGGAVKAWAQNGGGSKTGGVSPSGS